MSLTGEAAEERKEQIFAETRNALEKSGLTLDYLTRKLKKELNAKVTKTQKIKGAVHDLPKQFRKITTTGIIEYVKGEDGPEREYSDGESLIQWDEDAMDIRQKARIDAHRLRGDYPAEKHEVNVTGNLSEKIRDARQRSKARS
jgi:hypothetical protein